MEGKSNVELVETTVINAWAVTDGGFFYAAGLAGSTLDLTTGFTLAGCQATNGCFHVSADMDVTQNIIDVDTSDTSYDVEASDITGGLWYFAADMSGDVILKYGKYSNLNAGSASGGFLYSAADSFSLVAEHLTIYCQTGVAFSLSDIQQQLEASAGPRSGAFYITDTVSSGATVASANNLIQDCYTATTGGGWTLIGVKDFVDTDSVYHQTAAVQGGLIWAEDSRLTMTNIEVSTHAAKFGGLFYLKHPVNPDSATDKNAFTNF